MQAIAQDTLTADAPVPFEAVPAEAATPFGGVAISPTRVVLEGAQRTGQVTLYNSGSKPVTYRIETVDMEPLREGGYKEPEADAPTVSWSAVPIMRYAPRQVTLGPKERQVVKILSRARRDTPPGEYRTHLRFSSIPLVEAADSDAPEAGDGKSVSVSVGLEYRITIPLILRVGELSGGTEITAVDLRADQNGAGETAQVTLTRTGEKSDYTTLRLLDAAGAEIGLLKGVSVLPPLTERIVSVPIKLAGQRPAKVVLERDGTAKSPEVLDEYRLN